MPTSPRRPERSREKRRQILAGARAAFDASGYERTSVDEIAVRAGVSKATVYGHFDDKEALFVACFSEEADELRDELRRSLGEPEGDLPEALQRFGEKLVRVLVSPAFVCLFRHTAAEAGRFPEVGRTLFARGPEVVYDALAAWLGRWQARGALALEEPRTAAVQLVLLCHGELLLRAQLGLEPRPSAAEVRQTVRRGVRTFLRAYAPSR